MSVPSMSTVPDRTHPYSPTHALYTVVTNGGWVKCQFCKNIIEVDTFCWEIQSCKHKYHEECYKNTFISINMYKRCLYCFLHK